MDERGVRTTRKSTKNKRRSKSKTRIPQKNKNTPDLTRPRDINFLHSEFELAIGSGDKEIVKDYLRDKNFDPTYDNSYALKMALEYDQPLIARILVTDKRFIPNGQMLVNAASRGYLDIVRYILKEDIENIENYGNEAARAAHKSGQDDVVALLIKDKRINPIGHSYNTAIILIDQNMSL